MTVNYQIIREADGTASVSAFLGGKLQLADAQHPNFTEICTVLVATAGEVSESDLIALFDIPMMVGQIFETLSPRVTASGNRVYFDHEEMANPLTNAILRFKQQGLDFQHLVNFFEKVATNPQPYSQEQLYNWLDRHDFTITPEGDIIAYKGVTQDWMSTQRGKAIVDGVVVEGLIPYRIGSVIQMPRGEVTFDPNAACSVGLHAATFGFATGYGRRVVAVKVNPRDVVSVPTADVKMRVCELTVLEEVTGPYESALRPVSFPTTDDDGNEIIPEHTEGQDRESYTDTQDRENYEIDPDWNDQVVTRAPARVYEPDPELERLLAEEEENDDLTQPATREDQVNANLRETGQAIMDIIRNLFGKKD